MSIDWSRFAEVIRSAQRCLLVSHIRPDCDALGSELGMAEILEAVGKEVLIVNGHATPPNLQFIDPQQRLRAIGIDLQPGELPPIDLILILDTSAWAQLGNMADVVRASTAKKIVVDHHVGEDDLGAELFKNTRAEATGRLVVEAAHALGVKLTSTMARPLYAAIATDTGWFRFGSTTADTMRYGAELIEAGAVPSEIFNALYEQDTLARVQLRGRILARTQCEAGGRLAHTAVHHEDFEATGAHPSDTEDVVNATLCIAGTQAAVIFVQLGTGGYKISFRSRTPKFDCNAVAKQFGGGGHKAAAGATIVKPFAEVQAMVLAAVRAVLETPG